MIILSLILGYLLPLFLAFGRLPYTFFQQDEWAIFGNYIYWDKAHLSWIERLFTYEQFTHLIPFSNIISYLQFKLFGLHFFWYGVSAMLFQGINALLVYYLAEMFFKKKIVSFLSGLLFLTYAISQQAITWVATTTGTAGATLFLLLSLIFFKKYFSLIQRRKVYLFFAFFFMVVSFGFKETSVFIFLFLPFFWYMYEKRKKKKIIHFLLSLFLTGVFYGVLRVIFSMISYAPAAQRMEALQPGITVYLFRIFTVPLKVLAQSILPVPVLLNFSNLLVSLAYPQFVNHGSPNPYIVESVSADIISYAFALIVFMLLGFIIWILRKKNKKNIANILFLSLVFILLSSFPLIIIPGKAGFFSLLDGRHLYLTSIFTSILIAGVVYAFFIMLPKRNLIKASLIIILTVYLFTNIKEIRNATNQQVGIAFTRKSILSRIEKQYPKLPQNVIFYIESDKPYYGLPDGENIVPFQSGFGQTLLVWYNAKGENFPSCLFKDQFLYVLLSQEYKACDGRGFGYFRKLDMLKTAVKMNHIRPQSIIAFTYKSNTNDLTDISKKIQKEVQE